MQGSYERVRERGIPTMAILLVIAGMVLLLQTLDVLTWRLWAELLRYWPVLLIVVGLSILFGRRTPLFSAALVTLVVVGTVILAAFTVGPRPEPVVADRDVSIRTAFGSTNRTVTSEQFRGGEITAAFGSVDLDLRQASLTEQGGRLDVTVAFGSVDIRVPGDWNIRVEGTAALGSVEDNRAVEPREGPTLVLDAAAAFGSVRLRN